MKKILLIFLLPVLLASSCKKNKSPEEQLPPETQTGAGTFGCLVNGNVFLPKGNPLGGPILSCAYQFINGGYYFQLKAFNNGSPESYSIGIFTDSLKIQEGGKYILKNKNVPREVYGQYGIYNINNGGTLFLTNSISSGELFIKKLDEGNRIVSGTFWFDAVSSSGDKVQIRDGRFDMKYTL